MFVLKIVTDFASAHSLRNYPGDCSRLHGHNWQVEVSVCSQVLDDNGIAIDFREIKKQTKLVIKRVDHQYLNEIEPFDVLNPTAENIAVVCWNLLRTELDAKYELSIKLWETENNLVEYSGK